MNRVNNSLKTLHKLNLDVQSSGWAVLTLSSSVSVTFCLHGSNCYHPGRKGGGIVNQEGSNPFTSQGEQGKTRSSNQILIKFTINTK